MPCNHNKLGPARLNAQTQAAQVMRSMHTLWHAVQNFGLPGSGKMHVCAFTCVRGDSCQPVEVTSIEQLDQHIDSECTSLAKKKVALAEQAPYHPIADAAPLPDLSEYDHVCRAIAQHLTDDCWSLDPTCDHAVQIVLYTCGSERILPDQVHFFDFVEHEVACLAERGVRVTFSFFGFAEANEYDTVFMDMIVALSWNPAKAAMGFRLRNMMEGTRELVRQQEPVQILSTVLKKLAAPNEDSTADDFNFNLKLVSVTPRDAFAHKWVSEEAVHIITPDAYRNAVDLGWTPFLQFVGKLRETPDPPLLRLQITGFLHEEDWLDANNNFELKPDKKAELLKAAKDTIREKEIDKKKTQLRQTIIEKTGLVPGESADVRINKIHSAMNKLGKTETCSPWIPVESDEESRRDFGETLYSGKYFKDRQGQRLKQGDFRCSQGGHCVYREELVLLFGTKDIDNLLDKSKTFQNEDIDVWVKRQLDEQGGEIEVQVTKELENQGARIDRDAVQAAIDFRQSLKEKKAWKENQDALEALLEWNVESIAWDFLDVYSARLNPQLVRVKGVSAPQAESEEDRAQFYINDVLIRNGPTGKALPVSDGLNVMTIDQNTGAVLTFENFATHDHDDTNRAGSELIEHIGEIDDGRIVMVAAGCHDSRALSGDVLEKLKDLGGSGTKFEPTASFVLTGVKRDAKKPQSVHPLLATVELIDNGGYPRKASFQFVRPLQPVRKQHSGNLVFSGDFRADIVESRLPGTLYTVFDRARIGDRAKEPLIAFINSHGQFMEATVTKEGKIAPAEDEKEHFPVVIEQPEEVYKPGVNVGVWRFRDERDQDEHKRKDKFQWLCEKCVDICKKLQRANANLQAGSTAAQKYVVIVVMNSKERSRCWEEDDLSDYETYVQAFLNNHGEEYMCVYADECNADVAKWLTYLELPNTHGGPIGAVEVDFCLPLVDIAQRNVARARERAYNHGCKSKSCLPCGAGEMATHQAEANATNVQEFAVVLNHLTLPRLDEWHAGSMRRLPPTKHDKNTVVDWMTRMIPCASVNETQETSNDDGKTKTHVAAGDQTLSHAGLTGKFRSWCRNPFSFHKKVQKVPQLVFNRQRQAILRRVIRAQQKGAAAVIIPVEFDAYLRGQLEPEGHPLAHFFTAKVDFKQPPEW